ncbi:MAG: hypothetical protein HY876_04750 [Coriobacteriales bacterium]|nr:hypothetical protein [Coriobacteriales bacterium]
MKRDELRLPGTSAQGFPRGILWIAVVLVAVLVAGVVVAVGVTSTAGFLGTYPGLKQNYEAMSHSSHKGIACHKCHSDEGGALAFRAALVGDFYLGLFGKPDMPRLLKLAPPRRRACLTCHAHDWSDDLAKTQRLPHPAHLRVASEKRDCVKCHKWTAHDEEYMEKHKSMPMSAVCATFGCHVGTKARSECSTCHHALRDGKGQWRLAHNETVSESGPGSCLEGCHTADQCRLCHTTGKRPKLPKAGRGAAVKIIERGHAQEDWIERHGGLAVKDEAKCFACHVSVGECEDCHSKRPASHGLKTTWLQRHKRFAKDERRCVACHERRWCEDCHTQFKEMR